MVRAAALRCLRAPGVLAAVVVAVRVPEPHARIALGPSLPTLELAAAPTSAGGAFSASIQF